MARVIPGGAYRDTAGAWHNADGKPLEKAQIAAAERAAAEQQQWRDEIDAAQAASNPDALKTIAALLRGPAPTTAPTTAGGEIK